MKSQWTLIFGLIFAIIISIFAIVNMEKVPVDYVFGESYVPLVLVILFSALLGALISISFSAIKIFSSSRKVTALEKQLNQRDSIIVEKDREIVRLQEELAKPPVIETVQNPDENLFM